MLPKSTGSSRLVPLRVFASPFGILALGVVLNFAALSQIAIASTRLVMVTSDHCPFCQAWERDIGVVYEKSPYAPSFPLTRVDIGSAMPEGVTLQSPVLGTPTFLIIQNGQEIDRRRGYDDAGMFWWWLSDHAAE